MKKYENEKAADYLQLTNMMYKIFNTKFNDVDGNEYSESRLEDKRVIIQKIISKFNLLKVYVGSKDKEVRAITKGQLIELANYCIMEVVEMTLEEENNDR